MSNTVLVLQHGRRDLKLTLRPATTRMTRYAALNVCDRCLLKYENAGVSWCFQPAQPHCPVGRSQHHDELVCKCTMLIHAGVWEVRGARMDRGSVHLQRSLGRPHPATKLFQGGDFLPRRARSFRASRCRPQTAYLAHAAVGACQPFASSAARSQCTRSSVCRPTV